MKPQQPQTDYLLERLSVLACQHMGWRMLGQQESLLEARSFPGRFDRSSAIAEVSSTKVVKAQRVWDDEGALLAITRRLADESIFIVRNNIDGHYEAMLLKDGELEPLVDSRIDDYVDPVFAWVECLLRATRHLKP